MSADNLPPSALQIIDPTQPVSKEMSLNQNFENASTEDNQEKHGEFGGYTTD